MPARPATRTHVANFLDGVRTASSPTPRSRSATRARCSATWARSPTASAARCTATRTPAASSDDAEADALWTREYAPGWEPKV